MRLSLVVRRRTSMGRSCMCRALIHVYRKVGVRYSPPLFILSMDYRRVLSLRAQVPFAPLPEARTHRAIFARRPVACATATQRRLPVESTTNLRESPSHGIDPGTAARHD